MINIITLNCENENINCCIALYERIISNNNEYNYIKIRKSKNEFKIQIKEQHQIIFLSFLQNLNIKAKIITPKHPFFISNLPKGISSAKLTEQLQTHYPDSSLHIFKSNNRCGKFLVPTSILNLYPELQTASKSTEGTPISIQPFPCMYLRPFQPKSSPKPKPAQSSPKLKPAQSSSTYAAVTQAQMSAPYEERIESLESQLQVSTSKITHIEKQIQDLKSSQAHLEAKTETMNSSLQQIIQNQTHFQHQTNANMKGLQASLNQLIVSLHHCVPQPVHHQHPHFTHQQNNKIIHQTHNPTESNPEDMSDIVQTPAVNPKRTYSASPTYNQLHPTNPARAPPKSSLFNS